MQNENEIPFILLHSIQLEGSEFPIGCHLNLDCHLDKKITINNSMQIHHSRFDIIKPEMMHLVVTHLNNTYK